MQEGGGRGKGGEGKISIWGEGKGVANEQKRLPSFPPPHVSHTLLSLFLVLFSPHYLCHCRVFNGYRHTRRLITSGEEMPTPCCQTARDKIPGSGFLADGGKDGELKKISNGEK